MKFIIKKMSYAIEQGGKNFVVTHIEWEAFEFNADGKSVSVSGITQLPSPESSFTEWSDITESIAMSWLLNSMPESSKADLEELLKNKLNNLNQTDGSGLPWSSN